MRVRRKLRRRSIKIRRGSHNNNTSEIDKTGGRGAHEGFEHRAVFLGCGAVVAGAVCEELGLVSEGFAEDGTRVADV